MQLCFLPTFSASFHLQFCFEWAGLLGTLFLNVVAETLVSLEIKLETHRCKSATSIQPRGSNNETPSRPDQPIQVGTPRDLCV